MPGYLCFTLRGLFLLSEFLLREEHSQVAPTVIALSLMLFHFSFVLI
jgi:hypothetical protein